MASVGNREGIVMPVKIIPHDLPFRGAGAEAEKRMLDFLKSLPDSYFVLRECKIGSSVNKKASGSLEDKPDFVVIGPAIGVVVLEVKDWNIYTNRFEYADQYWVHKINIAGNREMLKNPYAQAAEYFHAVNEFLQKQNFQNKLWISSFVAYPKLTRNEFQNMCVSMNKGNPQQEFIFDLRKTLFLDDLLVYRDAPLTLLERYVSIDLKAHQKQVATYTEQQVSAGVSCLVPSEMRVGGLPDVTEAERTLALLDEKQQEWAFNELTGKQYLSDVAGSGKTNVLLSRAIYWAKQHIVTGGCLILVVTYSEALRIELERIFQAKITGDPVYDYYRSRIRIYNVVTLMEEILKEGIGKNSFERWHASFLTSHQDREYIEEILPEKCIDLLMANKKRFQIYDYLLIDEIQDFNTWFLEVTMSLLKDRKNIFVVGDVGQKLFDRDIEWGEFDIVKQRAEIQSRFLMYRSPRPVAKLAWKFLIFDKIIEQNLKEEGYKTDIKPRSHFMYKPVFIPHSTEEELLQHICNDVRERLYTAQPKQILCIGLKDGMVGHFHHMLTTASVPVRWATEVSSSIGNYVVLADYVESKGLEREYVYILDADSLAAKSSPFASVEQNKEKNRRDRIKLFIALTRGMREVRLYYINQHHTFIRELLHIQSTM